MGSTIETIKQMMPLREAFRQLFPDHHRESGNMVCPYHGDTDPSAQVDDTLFYCHGCQRKADVIDLFALANSCTIKEAISRLAGELGLDTGTPSNGTGKKSDIPTIEEVFFRRGLLYDGLKHVLKNRVRLFRGNARYKPALAIELTKITGETATVEKESGRAMPWTQFIPLDGSDKRFMGGTIAKEAAFILDGEGDTIICEAVFDALSLKTACPDARVISIMGAGFTGKLGQLPVTNPILAFDNDDPGRKATIAARKIYRDQCRVISWDGFPEKADPNDVLRNHGADRLREIIEAAVPATDMPTDTTDNEDIAPDTEAKTKQADILIMIGRRMATYFHDTEGDGYAKIPVNGHVEIHPIRGRGFRDALRRSFFSIGHASPSSQALQDAVETLDAMARYDWPEEETHIRIAHKNGNIYLDLADKDWRVVEISRDGWDIVSPAPVNFRRVKGMLPLPLPTRDGHIDDLRPCLNIPDGAEGDATWVLIVAWLLGCLGTGPYPILVLQAEQGSGKSFTSTALKNLIDPTVAPIRTPPREERDLVMACVHGHAVCYDNLSGIQPWLSDALCRVATGAGFAARKYYTDNEETVHQYKKPLLLNGIDRVTSRNDLTDRSIIVGLPPIPTHKRRDESEIQAAIDAAMPGALGHLLTAASVALRNEAGKPDGLPRMADFARWVHQGEKAFGWKPGTFMAAYEGNRAGAIETSIEGDTFATAVRDLVQRDGSFDGTATELLAALNEFVTDDARKQKSWPKAANAASSRLRRAAPFLREIGINVIFPERGNKKRTLRVDWVRKSSSPSSPSSFHSDSEGLSGDDLFSGSSPSSQRSSPHDCAYADEEWGEV